MPDDRFLASIPTFSQFEGVADGRNYRPLPQDWALATTDIVGSTEAIDRGRYKAVNMAGASMISALLNALGRRDLPFVFGGDGALVALPEALRSIAVTALAATQAWVADELDLTMRAAIVPLSDIRAQGLDVRVGLFKASPGVSYAMFTGGGASWAEAEMKAGRYSVPAAASGTRPDLTGLSCRWDPIQATRGEIVSIIAVPASGTPTTAFQQFVTDVLAIAGEQERGGHPISVEAMHTRFPPPGLDAEVRARAPAGHRFFVSIPILLQTAALNFSLATGLGLGRFSARHYVEEVSANSDFRKFDDGLKLTLDLDRTAVDRIEQRLKRAEAEGVARYGLHRQDSALMTCFVASPLQRDHVHFIDGASGGYAMAAANLKAKATATV